MIKQSCEDIFIFRSKSKSGRQRVHKIRAPSFELAKEKAILQFSDVLYFKPKTMDLITAIDRAKKASKDTKKTYYIILDEDGECSIGTAPLRGATHKFTLGMEDKTFHPNGKEETKPIVKSLPAQSEKAQKIIAQKTAKESAEEDSKNIKKQNKMEKTAKKPAAKTAKKAPAKNNGEEKLVRGNNMSLTAAEWKKVDALLAKQETSFSAWSKSLVLAKIK